MRRKIHTLFSTQTALVPLLVAMTLFLWSPLAFATTINNNVSVSANGNGESSASVRTILNGEVVEDHEETSESGSIEYSSSITADDDVVRVETNTSTTAPSDTEAKLQSLLDRLVTLLTLYVSKLTQE